MKTVLIIEDDRVVAATYRHKFKEAGFIVEVATDGVEGVKLVCSLRPDAVILDLLMPRLDGLEVLKFIRGHPELSATPVVVFSNSYMTNLVENAWRAGADECLMKASTMPAQLLATVNKVMSRAGRRTVQATSQTAPVVRGVAAPVDPLALAAPREAPGAMTPIPAPPKPVAAPAPPASETKILFDLPATAGPVTAIPIPPDGSGNRFTVNYDEPPFPSKRFPTGGTTFFIAGTKLVAEPDTEFHAQIRELFLNGSADRLETIRGLAAAVQQAKDEAVRLQQLHTLFAKVHGLAGNAGLAGCTTIAQFASTLEVLIKEMREQPSFVNGSTLQSINRAVATLDGMLSRPLQVDGEKPPRLSALVVESDPAFSRTAAMALEAGRVQATTTEDPVYAIGLLATSNYDLVVSAIHLEAMTGFELYSRMESLPHQALTPLVFVTTHDNFASYALDELVARHDLIARPYPPIELTLKALMLAERRRAQP